jgi:hypothetical protein
MSEKKLRRLIVVLVITIFVTACVSWPLPTGLFKTLLLLAVALLAPVIIVVYYLMRRKFHKYVFCPLSPSQLGDGARRYFDNWTPEMTQIELNLLGDFMLLPWPDSVYARCFASKDGQVFADITDVGHGMMQSFSFESVLSDGLYVESSSLDMNVPQPDADIDNMHWEFLPGASLPELYQHHRNVLERLCQERNCEVLSFAPKQFRDVIDYGHRLVNWRLYREGRVAEPPTPLDSCTPQPDLVLQSD